MTKLYLKVPQRKRCDKNNDNGFNPLNNMLNMHFFKALELIYCINHVTLGQQLKNISQY